ncbi:MAG TPA: 4-(cytidine 5'-diphospho)-2-C-methyl-D-erythritol kinase [Porticoccaceae bacterium]|nr:4-(cytidine 5'-diphospho)-2-C-methyl-D-erythritol kinase [Porticoccaceae bacterium]HCO60985.1 4-(cytidine 5'-diphospho)-2-C-methyl-D-erythritol kinase [Porticoccaceae bacterium]
MLTLLAPAKLNLFLRITGRREDGYHSLQTVFQLLNYGDELNFRLRPDATLTLQVQSPSNSDHQRPADLNGDDNLVLKAARALLADCDRKLGADITLIKRLPVGGGLGGGSSDAATTLLALNRLWNLEYDLERLAELGLQLGADVPVFIRGRSAWAEGIGEVLTPVELPRRWFVVIAPNCVVSTATVFADPQLTRNSSAITIRAFREHGAGNDCQEIVEKHFPEVKIARHWLNRFAPARMTGTGSCVFAAFESEVEAQTTLAQKPERWRGFIARGVNISPAHQPGMGPEQN